MSVSFTVNNQRGDAHDSASAAVDLSPGETRRLVQVGAAMLAVTHERRPWNPLARPRRYARHFPQFGNAQERALSYINLARMRDAADRQGYAVAEGST